jgi:hypothetical protein
LVFDCRKQSEADPDKTRANERVRSKFCPAAAEISAMFRVRQAKLNYIMLKHSMLGQSRCWQKILRLFLSVLQMAASFSA